MTMVLCKKNKKRQQNIASIELINDNTKYFVSAFYGHLVNEHRKPESEPSWKIIWRKFLRETHIVGRETNEYDIVIGDLNFPLLYDEGVISGKI